MYSYVLILHEWPRVFDRFNLGGGAQIFDRIGTVGAPNKNKGTPITFQNLSYDISSSDIRQLCETVGEVNDVKFEDKQAHMSTAAEGRQRALDEARLRVWRYCHCGVPP